MTSIFETVGYFGHRVQFSPFIDNMLYCVSSSNTECILNNSPSASSVVKSSSGYLLDISEPAAGATTTTTASASPESSSSSLPPSGSREKHETSLTSTRGTTINSLPYFNHESSLTFNLQANLPSASAFNSPSSSASSNTGFLYILDHFIEDIANPLKCFRSFYWSYGGLVDATWLNENYLWSVSTDGLIQIWNLSSYLPIEDALSDLEPSPDPVKVIPGHSKVINCIDCNLITSDNNLIATSSADSTIKLWDAKTASLVNSFNLTSSTSSSVNCSMSHQFTSIHLPMVKSSLTCNVNFNTSQNINNVTTGIHNGNNNLITSTTHNGNSQFERTHHQNVDSQTLNHNQEHSSSLLQLLENSQYFHQMDNNSQNRGNYVFNSSSSPPSSSISSPSSSTSDSAIHSPSSASSSSSSSYPNTPPSATGTVDSCDHRSPSLLQSILQSSMSPCLHSQRNEAVSCGHLAPNLIDISSVSWSPLISTTFASCSNDGQIRIWSPKGSSSIDHRPNLKFTTEINNLTSCDWNKYNEYLLAVSSTNGTISIWDIRSTNVGPVTVINGHKKPIKQVKFSPHSPYQLASVSCDATTKIWTLDANDDLYIHDEQINGRRSTSYSNNQRQSMSFSLNNTYRHHTDHVYGFDFNPSIKDRVVDCGRDSLVCLYSLSPSSLNHSLSSRTSKGTMVNLKSNQTARTNDVQHNFSLFSTAT